MPSCNSGYTFLQGNNFLLELNITLFDEGHNLGFQTHKCACYISIIMKFPLQYLGSKMFGLYHNREGRKKRVEKNVFFNLTNRLFAHVWLPLGSHLALSRLPFCTHLALIQLSFVSRFALIWPSLSSHLALSRLSFGSILSLIWFPFRSYLAPI